ncbi:MAG: hypothetical protein WC947_03090 [Elusimicrobiota bacterium]
MLFLTKVKLSNYFTLEKMFLLIASVVLIVWSYPIWYVTGKAVLGDGNMIFQRFEALRQTVVNYKQWPGLNPWNAGGQPLEGVPYLFIFSIRSLFVIVFGTSVGMGITFVVYLIIGYIGAWKLSTIWWNNAFVKHFFAIFVVTNAAVLIHISAGHMFSVYYLTPLLFYYFLRFKEDAWSGLKAAVVYGFAFNDIPNYTVQYMTVIIALLFCWFLFIGSKEVRLKMLRWLALFTVIILTLISYHLITILQIANEYPRISDLKFHYSWDVILKTYFYPFTHIAKVFADPPGVSGGSATRSTHETACYVGIVSMLIALASFRRGLKWWHTITIILILAGVGNNAVYWPMYWLQKLPTFSSHLAFARVRMITLFFIGVMVTWGLWFLWEKYKTNCWGRKIVIFIGLFIVLEHSVLGFLIIRGTHVDIDKADPFYRSHYPYIGRSINSEFMNISVLPPYESTKLNIGILRGGGDSHLPMNYWEGEKGYKGPLGSDEKGYIAEFVQGGKGVKPVSWSPNRIKFKDLKPNHPLTINMNPSRAWYNNGRQLFPKYRIIEVYTPFAVMPDENGIVDLTYRYPGKTLGMAVTVFMFMLSIVVIRIVKRNYGGKVEKI